MKQQETDGKRLFKLDELLDVYQFKSYFGQPMNYLKKLLNNAKSRAEKRGEKKLQQQEKAANRLARRGGARGAVAEEIIADNNVFDAPVDDDEKWIIFLSSFKSKNCLREVLFSFSFHGNTQEVLFNGYLPNVLF